MALNGDILPIEKQQQPRRRNIPRREWAKREIRRLLIEEGLTNRQICERLNLPSRTLDRCLHEIYAFDNQLLINPSIEDTETFANIFIERLTQQRQDVLKDIAKNPNTTPTDKIEAHHLAAELARVAWMMTKETPATLARQVPLRPSNHRLIQEQRGLNLTVSKPLSVLPTTTAQSLTPITTTETETTEETEEEEIISTS